MEKMWNMKTADDVATLYAKVSEVATTRFFGAAVNPNIRETKNCGDTINNKNSITTLGQDRTITKALGVALHHRGNR